MQLPIVQIDAFADRVLSGNPAAVMRLPRWLDNATLLALAAENNLSETAYVVREGDVWRLRWFTPTVEVDLCGHATSRQARCSSIETRSGPLSVRRVGDAYALDLPALPPRPAVDPSGALVEVLGHPPRELFTVKQVHCAAY